MPRNQGGNQGTNLLHLNGSTSGLACGQQRVTQRTATEVARELVSSLPGVVLRAAGSLSGKGQVTFIQQVTGDKVTTRVTKKLFEEWQGMDSGSEEFRKLDALAEYIELNSQGTAMEVEWEK